MARRKSNREKNLMKRGATWYVETIVDGQRIKKSLRTSIKEEAIQRRESVLREAIAERERGEDDAYAWTTVRRWESALREGGPVIPFLGPQRIDAIDGPALREWWDAAIARQGRRGQNERDAIGVVFTYARDRGLLPESHDPVAQLGRQLAKRGKRRGAKVAKIKRGRLAKEGRLRAEDFGRLTKAAREDRHPEAYILVLLAAECGLRRGEISGLHFEDLVGAGEDDPRRHLYVNHSRSSGGPLGLTKIGKPRKAPVSRRLWRALEELRSRREAGGPCVVDLAGKPVGAKLAEPSPYVLTVNYFDMDKQLPQTHL